MIVGLRDAEDPQVVGRKAAVLGRLLRSGFDVPPGFVVPVGTGSAGAVEQDLLRAYSALGAAVVAVRSSATTEDGPDGSAAGRHDSFLGVEGEADLLARVDDCLRSLHGPRVPADGGGAMGVLVQQQVDADVAGVVATVDPLTGAPPAVVEASWGLGEAVVGGLVDPDRFLVAGGGVVGRRIGTKAVRSERVPGGTTTVTVPVDDRSRPCLDYTDVLRVAALAARVADLLGGPQDVEWALAGGRLVLLQARPLTGLPARPPRELTGPVGPLLLSGTPASRGRARGVARVVADPAGGGDLRAGEVLVCRTTDPSWTPLLSVASAVVTETGGVLAHAAIVARERGIPAVVGAAGACTVLGTTPRVVVDGTAGTVESDVCADVDAPPRGASTR